MALWCLPLLLSFAASCSAQSGNCTAPLGNGGARTTALMQMKHEHRINQEGLLAAVATDRARGIKGGGCDLSDSRPVRCPFRENPLGWDTQAEGPDRQRIDECITRESVAARAPVIEFNELMAFIRSSGAKQSAVQVEIGAFVGANGRMPLLSELQTLRYLSASSNWTNWSDEDQFLDGAGKLVISRGLLELFNLKSTYPGTLIGGAEPGQHVCTEDDRKYRTATGKCNDVEDTLMGAANTRFGRNVPLNSTYPDEATLLQPDPRMLARKLLHKKGKTGRSTENGHVNLLAGSWIQFMTHDWFDHASHDRRQVGLDDYIRVPLDKKDPLRKKHGMDAMKIGRTIADPTGDDGAQPPSYVNAVTHWWDASQLYGSDQETQDRLRSFQGGKMLVDDDFLPESNVQGQSDAGFTRNWWVGLEMMHTLFIREHNAVCDMLAAKYPHQSDHELFNTARLIISALLAKIHTLEWTPAIIPHPYLETGMYFNWKGAKSFLATPLPPGFTTGDPGADGVINGYMGAPRDLGAAQTPQFLTEEFTSVYRMHSLLPDKLTFRAVGCWHSREYGEVCGQNRSAEAVPLTEALAPQARSLVRADLEGLLYSFGRQNAHSLVLNNYPAFLSNLQLPNGDFVDVATIDLIRDRERGVPRFNEARRLLGLQPFKDFVDITGGDKRLARKLKKAYGGDIENIDFMIGWHAEGVRPDCFGFSETAFQVFLLMATRRLKTDRFFTDDYKPEVYTAEGLEWVESNTFKSVLERHFPRLKFSGLKETDNAFMPWVGLNHE